MRILIVSPGSVAVPGGNSSSVLRLQTGLLGLGHTVQVCEANECEAMDLTPGSFDVVHGFHIYKGGRAALEAARSARARLVVTLTGTETSLDWQDPIRRAGLLKVLGSGAGVIALRQNHLEELRALSGMELVDSAVIPQTIHMGQEPFDLRDRLGLDPAVPLVLLPGGLRPVKGQDWALDVLENSQGEAIPWHLVLLGPILESEFAQPLLQRVEACERAHYLGAIDSGRMGACYGACDLVLNTSASEGESNAILEAMLIGRAVIARNNAGNRALIESERTGVLFETREELAAGIQRLLAEDVHRAALEAAAQASVRDRADVGVEIRAHLDFYGKRGPVGGPSAQRS